MSENQGQNNQGTPSDKPQSEPQQPGQPQQPWGQQPQQPGQPGQPQQPWGQQPGQPQQPWGQQPQQPGQPQQPWGQQPQQPGQPGQPQQPWGQQPGQPQQWGQQPQQPQQPGQPQQPWDQQPSPYGAYGEVPQKKRSLAWLWILLGLLVVLIIAGVFVWKLLLSSPSIEDLNAECASGSAAACEDLFQKAADGSSDLEFGRTCGGRTDGTIACDLADMSAPAGSWSETDSGAGSETDSGAGSETDSGASGGTLMPLPFDDPNGCMEVSCESGMDYGDNARLDNLFDQCGLSNMQACDELYMLSEGGSEYEEFANPCGDLQAPGTGGWCSPESAERWS